MAIDLSNMSMMDLFRMEAANLTEGMTTALIDLEARPTDSGHFENLMRAAHSLKGAARIVGVEQLVSLGHAMEDRLTCAQRLSAPLATSHVDALLQAVDVFAKTVDLDDTALPVWLQAQEAAIAQLVRTLGAEAVLVSTPALAPTPVQAPQAPAPETPAAETPPAAPKDKEPASAVNRSLRLEATQLESLLGLARESVLVNRSHQRQAGTLQHLRLAQRRIDTTLDRLQEALRQGQSFEALQHLLSATTSASRATADALDVYMHDHANQTRRGHRIATRLHHTINSTRMTRFGSVSASMKRLARDTGLRLGKDIALTVEGMSTLVDRDVLDRIEAPLAHMVRNAIDHGLESAADRQRLGKAAQGKISVMARHHRGHLEVTVRDNGRGIDLDALRGRIAQRGLSSAAMLANMADQELLAFLFLPGFSTRDTVSETSGRGVGLDVVQTCVQELRGRLHVDNRIGEGMAITLVLPVSLSLVRALLLQVGNETYALPLSQLERIVTLPASEVCWVAGKPCIQVNGQDIGMAHLGPILGLPPSAPAPMLTLVEVATSSGRFALAVDRLMGESDLALQALDARLKKPLNVSAAAVLDDGSPVLVLDVGDLASTVALGGTAPGGMPWTSGTTASALEGDETTPPPQSQKRILVVEDSFTVREVERKVLTSGGYAVDVTVDGMDGWNAICSKTYDLVVTDIDMPRMNGLELLRRIRANEATRALPVMIVSYKDREEDRMAGLQAGADRYFVKSGFEEAALLEAVADLIG